MKIRSGFVSNSSSSSFVVFGYKMDEVLKKFSKEELLSKFSNGKFDEHIKKWGVNDAFYEFMNSTNFGIDGIGYVRDDGPGFIGVVLADIPSDGGYADPIEMTLDELVVRIGALKDKLGLDSSPGIIAGTAAR